MTQNVRAGEWARGQTMDVPQEALDQAAALRAKGLNWSAVSRETGYSTEVLRNRLDPEYASRRRHNGRRRVSRKREERHTPYARSDHHIKPEVLDALRATIPPDTRTFTARMLGDPIPGRSALDKRRKDSAPVHKWATLVAGAATKSTYEDRYSISEAVH